MKFGIYPPTGWLDYDKWNIQSALFETAKAAEALRYDGYWVNDVVIINASNQQMGKGVIEPLITVASLIHVVPDLNFGVSVLVLPQRHSFVVAKQVAALDLLSNGRFTLGIGTGWREHEFELLGADFKNRGAITDEAIEVLRLLWNEPTASYAGKYHQFSDALFYPKPTDGGPPIWIGGNGQRAIRRASKYGNGWVPFGVTVDELSNGVKMLHDLTQDRPMPTVAVEMSIRVVVDGKPKPEPRAGTHSIYEPTIEGSSDEIVQVLKAYEQVGLNYVICIFYANQIDDLLDQMQIFAEQVMPHFPDAA